MAPRKKATPAVENNETIETKAVVSESAADETTPVKKTRTRKTAVKADDTKAEETKTTKAAAKKTAESKTTKAAKTTDEPKTTKAAAKKTASKKAVIEEAAAPKSEVFIEYGGAQVSVDEIIANARKIVGNDKDIKVYVQPDTSKAYIAFDGESVAMDVFFCK